jgi:uncharacterized protein (TIGR00369 family)
MRRRRFLPWSDTCFVCGEKNPLGLKLRFELEEDGRVVIDPLVFDTAFEGYPEHVHGGVVTAALDESAGWACTVRTGSLYFTAELTVRFRRAVPGGVPLRLEAECLEVRRRLARGHSRILDAEGRVLAEAEGRFLPVPEEEQRLIVPELKMPGRPATEDDLTA